MDRVGFSTRLELLTDLKLLHGQLIVRLEEFGADGAEICVTRGCWAISQLIVEDGAVEVLARLRMTFQSLRTHSHGDGRRSLVSRRQLLLKALLQHFRHDLVVLQECRHPTLLPRIRLSRSKPTEHRRPRLSVD